MAFNMNNKLFQVWSLCFQNEMSNMEWILKLQTQHKKKYVQTCDFHNKEKSSQDILMLAEHSHVNCTSCCCFLDHNPGMGIAFKPSPLEFSLSSGGNFFCWIIAIIQIFMSNLRCFALFIRFVFALLSSFEKKNVYFF